MKPNHTLSPLQLEILLHYSYAPIPYPWPCDRPEKARVDILRPLVEAFLLTHSGSPGYDSVRMAITPVGKMYVEYILSTPLPVQTWTIPERKGESH